MSRDSLGQLLDPVITYIGGRSLDATLERDLNTLFPARGDLFEKIVGACKEGRAAGWLCEREAGGVHYGRAIKPSPATRGFSVDVVEMQDVVGPHHIHPNGEIDLIMPLEGAAVFDNRPAGWLVYGPGTAHRPTVSGGLAFVLYLLPAGAIEFTRS